MHKKKKTLGRLKEKYTTPRFVWCGTIHALTQAGSGNANEANSGTGSQKKKNSSDRKLKEDVVRISNHPLGKGLYLFNLKSKCRKQFSSDRKFGVMTDEVKLWCL